MTVLVTAAATGLCAFVVYVLIIGRSILLPLVIAIFVSYFVSVGAALASRLSIGGRPIPRFVRYAASLAILLLLARLMFALVLDNAGRVMASAPIYEQNLLRLANQGASRLGMEEQTSVRVLFEGLHFTDLLRSLTFGLTSLLGSFGTIGIYTVFLLLEQKHFDTKIAALFPSEERQALVRRILARIAKEVQTYVWLKTVISFVTSAASHAVMTMVGLDLAEFWALTIFGLNFIPYIGAWLGVIGPAALSLVQFESLTPFLVTTLTLAVIQFSGGSIIEPRVMGSGLNLSPVVMVLSLALWGTIWGVVGMFLAVPIMVVILIVCSHVEATRPIAVLLSANGELRT